MWGRLAAHDRDRVEQEADLSVVQASSSDVEPNVEELMDSRAAELVSYQSQGWADRYIAQVRMIQTVEKARVPGKTDLTRAVAENLFRLMAYKDEYEVARLFTDGRFQEELDRQFEGDYQLKFHLAPPVFARKDPHTGEAHKRTFGPWVFRVFKVLAKMRKVRGSWLDPFGYTHERRQERQLIEEYDQTLDELASRLSPANYQVAIELAGIPSKIRGFGHVKERNLAQARELEASLKARFRQEHNRIPDIVEVSV